MYSLTSAYSLLFSLLLLAISITVSVFFYRNSFITGFKKYFLISIKSIAIFLLLVLFLQPALLGLFKDNEKQEDIILVDVSRSFTLNSKDKTKAKETINLLKSNTFKSNSKYYTFTNGEIKSLSPDNFDSLKFDGSKTDLSFALEQLRGLSPETDINSITIISDGIFNSGGNPIYEAKKLNCPILAIGIGDTIQKKDALIDKVYYNEKSFTNILAKVKVDILSSGLSGQNINVKFLREDNIISSKPITIKDNSLPETVEFDITESSPAKVKYKVQIDNISGEVTDKNNSETFYIDFIDSKVNLLFISGGPSYDNALISSIIKRINNFTVTVKTLKTPTEFYEGTIDNRPFAELDAIFLFGFPSNVASQELANGIIANIKDRKIPVIFFSSKTTDYKKLSALDELIPFTYSSYGNESGVTPQIVSDENNPLKDLTGLQSSLKNLNGIVQKSGSEVLMIDRNSGEPLFIKSVSGDINSSAFLGYGLWKWRLNTSTNSEKTVEKLITESVNMTLKKDKKTKLKVYTEYPINDYADKIKLIAEVYDDNYKLTRNAKVIVKILNKENKIIKDLALLPADDKFVSSIEPLPIGDYRVEAEADINNNFYAKDENRFSVESTSFEFKNSKSNFESLKELSSNTKGSFLYFDGNEQNIKTNYNSLIDSINNTFTGVKQTRFNLWENKYILFFIILLFTIEWVIRKRNNIP